MSIFSNKKLPKVVNELPKVVNELPKTVKELPKTVKEAIPKAVKAVNERNFDRSFILFGKGSSGKSTLGNLILGETPFKEHEFPQAYGLTIKVHYGECQIEASKVYDQYDTCTTLREEDDMLNIQALDQPGFNDYNFTQEKLCKFLRECIAGSKAEMSASFLILIDLSSKRFSAEELLSVLNLAEILSQSRYSFFPNAVVVFTHSDKIDPELNEETLKEKLEEKLKTENFECVRELLDLVNERHIFTNGKDTSPGNREEILKKLFALTRPNLNVYINGNNGFAGEELKVLFGEHARKQHFKRNLLKYDVDYYFNPDLNIIRKFERHTLHDDIISALNKLSGISEGIAAVMLLISLEEVFNEKMHKLILNLPKTYNLGKDFKDDFWNYACIVFKVPVDSEECVKGNIKFNRLLKDLDIKVNSKYTWLTDHNSPDECSRRLTNLVRRVKLDTEGKSYTDTTVLAEMKQTIQGSRKHRQSRNKTQMNSGIKDLELGQEVPFFNLDSKVLVGCNNFFWDKEEISPVIGYYILKNINPELADQFREEYPDKDTKIPTEKYSQICLKLLKKI